MGAAQLRKEFPEIRDVLCRILTGAINSRDLARDLTMTSILHGIGGNTALNQLNDPTGKRLAHWPRSLVMPSVQRPLSKQRTTSRGG